MWARLRQEPAVIVALFGVAAVLLGFMREQAIAYRLGLSVTTDAFYLGLTLITFLPGLISGACLGLLAPQHARVVKEVGAEHGRALLGQILFICLGLGAVAVLLLWTAGAISYPFLSTKENIAKLQLTFAMSAGLSLAVPALCFSSGAVAALNVLGKYALGGASTAIAPLTAMAGLHLLPDTPWGLIGGMVLGLNLQALVLAWALAKEGVVAARKPAWQCAKPLLQDMGRLAAGGLAASLTTLAVQAMVATTGPNGVSAYTFGTKITWAYLGLTVLVLSTVMTPLLAARAAGLPYSRRRLRAYLWLALAAAGIGATSLVLGSDQIIRLFLARGAFSEDDVRAVSTVQILAAMQIPTYLLLFLGSRAVQSYRDTTFLSRMSWLQAGITLTLAWLLQPSLGTPGILLAIAFSYAASGVCHFFRYRSLRCRARRE
jgi:peptidoglycan biosynthesis protein MviN/MurJ (putative lipid II flippase)